MTAIGEYLNPPSKTLCYCGQPSARSSEKGFACEWHRAQEDAMLDRAETCSETFKEYLKAGMRAMKMLERDSASRSEKDAFSSGVKCALAWAAGYLGKFSGETEGD